MPAWRLSEGTLALPWAQDMPPTLTVRTSDEDTGGQDLCRFAARHSEAGKTGGAPQFVDLGGEVETS